MKATWSLIAGPTGAGKTTYARAFTERAAAVCFSIDEWMNVLFWPDLPDKDNYTWALERVARCEAQVANIALQLAHRGISSVLDLGLTTRVQRERWLERAAIAGVPLELHTLELPADVRWARVQARNEAKAETFVFAVKRAMFDDMERLWESPGPPEIASYAHFCRILE